MTARRGATSQSVSRRWLLWIAAWSRCQEDWRASRCSTGPGWLAFGARLFAVTLVGELSAQRWQVTRFMLLPGGAPRARPSLENGAAFISVGINTRMLLNQTQAWLLNHSICLLLSPRSASFILQKVTFQTWGLYTFLYWKLNTVCLLSAY